MTSILNVQNVTKTIQRNFWNRPEVILEDISLQIEKNEIFGFIGSNGAGKTTLMKCILGLTHYKGQITVFENKRFQDVKERIGYLPEQPYFYDYLYPKELLQFYCKVFRISSGDAQKAIEKVLQETGISDNSKQLQTFSKGMKQRISMAGALLNNPDFLLLDEPMSSLDPVGRSDFRNLMLRRKEMGTTIFFSTHVLSDLEAICDRIGIIKHGRLMAIKSINEIVAEANQHEIHYSEKGSDRLVKEEMAGTSEAEKKLRELLDAGHFVHHYGKKRTAFEDVIVKNYMAFE